MLIGNPNAGKTTVFNHLTGRRGHIGNFPGITLEIARGYYGTIEIIDLPGIYSLQPHSKDEAIAVEFLKQYPPDGIINCIDSTNLRRSLGLTYALTALKIPMIIVANMPEEQQDWSSRELEDFLKIPIFPAPKKNHWVPAVLIRTMLLEIKRKNIPPLLGGTDMKENFQKIDAALPFPCTETIRRQKSASIDRFLLHPLWGTLLFILTMSLGIQLVFHFLSPLLTNPLLASLERFKEMASLLSHPLLNALASGMIGGVGTVLSFFPAMLLFFLFLAILEDSGYMVRICYLAENIMAAFGLSGKSVVPLLIGFSCTVPAALATKTIPHPHQRRKSLSLLPFITCSAKLPLFCAIIAVFAPSQSLWLIPVIYLTGIGTGLLFALFTKKERQPLLLELPPLRLPQFKNLLARIYRQTAAFLQKAFTVLLIASVIVALLQQFTPSLARTAKPQESILAQFSMILAPLFRPIHLDHWILICALIAGLFAKESALSVLMVLSPSFNVFQGENLLPFLTFFLFYPPCTAALNTIKRESGSARFAIRLFMLHLALAYLAAFLSTFIKL